MYSNRWESFTVLCHALFIAHIPPNEGARTPLDRAERSGAGSLLDYEMCSKSFSKTISEWDIKSPNPQSLGFLQEFFLLDLSPHTQERGENERECQLFVKL